VPGAFDANELFDIELAAITGSMPTLFRKLVVLVMVSDLTVPTPRCGSSQRKSRIWQLTSDEEDSAGHS
jgi:hypothetical protein